MQRQGESGGGGGGAPAPGQGPVPGAAAASVLEQQQRLQAALSGAGGAPGPGPSPGALFGAFQQQHAHQQQQEAALALALAGGGGAGLAGLGGLGGLGLGGLGGLGGGADALRQQALLSQLGGAGGGGGAGQDLLLARILQQQGAGGAGFGSPGSALGGARAGGLAGLQAQHELELQLLQQQEAELARARRQRAAEAEAAAARAAAAAGDGPGSRPGGGAPSPAIRGKDGPAGRSPPLGPSDGRPQAPNSSGAATGPGNVARTPGSVVVPCRARGMPMDHNFRTAYFVIPETVEHGEELICSYFACRNAGIKFRYCSHCKIPVAKRNFRKRHNHGLMAPKATAGGESDEESEGGDGETNDAHGAKEGTPGAAAAARPAPTAEPVSSEVKSEAAPELAPAPPIIPQSRVAPEVTEQPKAGASAPPPSAPVPKVKIDAKRASRWESLLRERPSTGDSNAMSSWLLEVLAVSDLEKPLKDNGEDDGDVAAEHAQLNGVSPPEATTEPPVAVPVTDDKGGDVPATKAGEEYKQGGAPEKPKSTEEDGNKKREREAAEEHADEESGEELTENAAKKKKVDQALAAAAADVPVETKKEGAPASGA